MKILIVGAGSLGLLIAGKLSRILGSDGCLLTRTMEQAEQINGSGLYIIENNRKVRADIYCTSFEETQRARDPSTVQWDWVFLMTKQTHFNDSLERYLCKLMTGNTKLLCFQNGVGHVERLEGAGIPLNQIYVAVTTEGAKKDAGNIVIHTGHGVTAIGCAEKNENAGDLKKLNHLLKDIGMDSIVAEDINVFVWKKLLINSVINPLTSILNIRNGQLLSSPFYLKIMKELFDEAYAVLKGVGLSSEELWEQLLEVCRNTSENSSSMLQDLLAGSETEIEWINGSLIRLASQQHIKVPTHEAVYNMVKGLEQLKRTSQ